TAVFRSGVSRYGRMSTSPRASDIDPYAAPLQRSPAPLHPLANLGPLFRSQLIPGETRGLQPFQFGGNALALLQFALAALHADRLAFGHAPLEVDRGGVIAQDVLLAHHRTIP